MYGVWYLYGYAIQTYLDIAQQIDIYLNLLVLYYNIYIIQIIIDIAICITILDIYCSVRQIAGNKVERQAAQSRASVLRNDRHKQSISVNSEEAKGTKIGTDRSVLRKEKMAGKE